MKHMITLLLAAALLAGCTLGSTAPTGDTATDRTAAQNLVPNVSGYNRTDARNVSDALAKVGVGASALTGNLLVTAAIDRVDNLIQCYQNVGAVTAQVYTQVGIENLISGQMPRFGVVAVVNQDRISRNFLNCAIGGGPGGFSAQGASSEPCGGSGTKTIGGETIYYLYAGTDPSFCSTVQSHFDGLR